MRKFMHEYALLSKASSNMLTAGAAAPTVKLPALPARPSNVLVSVEIGIFNAGGWILK